MSKSYVRSKCILCDKRISNAGFAYVRHMRMHVRRGEATQKLSGDVWTGIYTFTAIDGGRPDKPEVQTSGGVAKEEGVSYPEGAK